MRALFSGGVDKMRVPRVADALSTLIHLYLFLFFAGLAIFLFNINHSVFICAVSWIGFFTVLYVWITVMPIFWYHSPYYAPLSSTAWLLHASILHAFFAVLAFIDRTFISRHTEPPLRDWSKKSEKYGSWMSGNGVLKAAEEATKEKSSKIDVEILDWTADIVDEDEKLEKFFDAIPGFLDSQIAKNLDKHLLDKVRPRIIESLEGFLVSNLYSNSVKEEIKSRRVVICMNATKAIGELGDIYKILSLLTEVPLGGDYTEEKFFEAIPNFVNSQTVMGLKDLKTSFPDTDMDSVCSKIVKLVEEFLTRNFSANPVSKDIKIRRFIICMRATKEIGEYGDIYSILSLLTKGTPGEDDERLEKLFEIIPDLFKYLSVPERDIDSAHYSELSDALDEFLRRTLSSNSVIESVKNRRLDIYLNAIKVIYDPDQIRQALSDILSGELGQLPQSIETVHILVRSGWCDGDKYIALVVRCLIASVLPAIQQRDDRWIALVADQFNLERHVLRDHIAHGDNSVLLAILIHVTRQVVPSDPEKWWIVSPLSKFDIRNTHPELQNKFCNLWNEIVRGSHEDSRYVNILREILNLHLALHPGTDAAPTAFDASTDDRDDIRNQPSYQLCNIATQGPNSTVPSVQESIHELTRLVSALVSHFSPQSSLSTANFTTNIVPNQPTGDILINEMGESSQTTTATFLAHPHPKPVPATVTPPIVNHPPSVSVEQGELSDIPQPISSDLTSVYLPGWFKHQDITGPYDASDITQISSSANQISQSIPNTVAPVQRSEGSTRVPPPVSDSDPQSSPIVMLPPPSSLILTELPPSVESALIQPDHLSHPLGSQSSILTTARSRITPQVAPVLDVDVTTSAGSVSSHEHYETRDPNPPTPIEASLQVQQSRPLPPS
jgi:hypothetical protein